jgi:L-serine dehydratase
MDISVFDLFSIGIGPSSSHTVGPMAAANTFARELADKQLLQNTCTITIDLYGSLALTGEGHGTDKALLLGLEGESPDTVDPSVILPRFLNICNQQHLKLLGQHEISFDKAQHLLMHNDPLPLHPNGIKFTAFDSQKNLLISEVYYSVGGGFIVTEAQFGKDTSTKTGVPFYFDSAAQLLKLCQQHKLSVAQLMLANEKTWRSESEIRKKLLHIADIMHLCIKKGCVTEGILPGGLNVKRRAPALYQRLINMGPPSPQHPEVMNWVNAFAMAVNEENAAGSRVVTAPTNGAAGIIPACLQYYKDFYKNPTDDGVVEFLLTAGAIATLYKKNASISGAEVGCQGEVGVACSMAAAALAAVQGGTVIQVENAAEIGMEHNLGLTCDPMNGLVQIPCIERNAMGAIKAINAAGLALAEAGPNIVSLDKVIATMKQTGKDMNVIYKETSLGGLAVNIPEC